MLLIFMPAKGGGISRFISPSVCRSEIVEGTEALGVRLRGEVHILTVVLINTGTRAASLHSFQNGFNSKDNRTHVRT